MTGWAAFWLFIAIFYIGKLMKYIIDRITYNNVKAIRDIARDRYENEIKKEIKRLRMNLRKEFDNSYDRVSDILDILYREEK